MEQQNVYVIVNSKGEYFNSISYDHVFWSDLPINARLFENEQRAKRIKVEDSRILKLTMKLNF